VGLSTGLGLALLSALFLHALYHGVFKGTLFLVVGSVLDAADSRNVYRVRNGIGHVNARGYSGWITAAAFIAGAFSISAIPPRIGYVR
jgi:formate hydrogenlyase subunit 3/multisubunit Na+/H+ antiporter MnhD subunit